MDELNITSVFFSFFPIIAQATSNRAIEYV